MLSTVSFAQKATVKGKITDGDEPMDFVTVFVYESQIGTTSDADGNYELELDAGEHILQISYVGFMSISRKSTLTERQVLTLNIDLTPRTPISRMRSLTEASITFMMPSPPT